MKRIINVESSVSTKKDLDEKFKTQTKFKQLSSKLSAPPFDIDKMKDLQKKVFNHIESKTSLFFLPQIKTPQVSDKKGKRSYSTVDKNDDLQVHT